MKQKTFSILILTILLSFSCVKIDKNSQIYDSGVSLQLANLRKENISEVQYNINFIIPYSKDSSVISKLDLNFNLNKKGYGDNLLIDFKEDIDNINSIKINGKKCKFILKNEHIIIPKHYLINGKNNVKIDFIAGEQSLNRNEDYNYTLLVPDRARTLFPCFDQPNIKAEYNLSLTIPTVWEGIANSPAADTTYPNNMQGFKTIRFKPTEPLSTYLFSFVSGNFQKSIHTKDGREIKIYHRETDKQKVEQLDDIANEVFASVDWLEEYTAIPYPFAKYDLIILPGFQYGGMEHTGATLYNNKTLFLPANPTLSQQMSRTQLIAHETAHMWFGDYVTMDWFSGVWIKEVFANFFAAQICRPLFPNVDFDVNDLGFYSAAYAEERTDGTNPIEQELPNLKYAGLIYGNIIYQKSPVVMNMLYELYGEDKFKQTIRDYLNNYGYSNASWDNFVDIMAQNKPHHLQINPKDWSNYWIYDKGMPHIIITQKGIEKVVDSGQNLTIDTIKGHYIPNLNGKYYGYVQMQPTDIDFVLDNFYKEEKFKPLLAKKSLLITLNENWLNNNIDSKKYLNYLSKFLFIEKDPQIFPTILGGISSICSEEEFNASGDTINNKRLYAEMVLKRYIQTKENEKYWPQVFRTLNSICVSQETINEIYNIWKTKNTNIKLNDRDYISMSYQLALKFPFLLEHAPCSPEDIIKVQRERLKSNDDIREYDFISKGTYYQGEQLDSLFNSLLDAKNRRIEPWAGSLLSYINHPIRGSYSLKYLRQGLEILPQIQATGDIFFPKRWCSALISGHNSKQAKEIIDQYIADNPDLLPLLKNKLLQTTYKLNKYN